MDKPNKEKDDQTLADKKAVNAVSLPDEAEEAEKKPAPPVIKNEGMRAALSGSFFVLFFIGLALLIGFILWFVFARLREAYPVLFVGAYEIVREKKQIEDAFGWGSEILVEKRPEKPAKIRFMLRDRNRKPITGAQVQATLTRKDNAREKFTVKLTSLEPGVYRGEVTLPGPAEWVIQIGAMVSETAYQTTENITLP